MLLSPCANLRLPTQDLTSDLIKGVNFPTLFYLTESVFLFRTRGISVVSSFNFNKLLLVQLFIAKRQKRF